MSSRIDNNKLLYHPQRVAEWLDKGDCFPIYVEIGLTDKCNHRCIYCALDWLDHKGHSIQKQNMINTLKDMAKHNVKSVMFAGEGEPLMHAHIQDFIKFAKESGMEVAVTTNGVLYNNRKIEQSLYHLSWIRFSVDSGLPESYAAIHGTKPKDLDTVLSNIEHAVKIKKDRNLNVDIGVQALLVNQSIDAIIILANKIKDIGVDNFQVKPYSQHPLSKNNLLINHDLVNLKKKFKTLETDKFKIYFRLNTIQRILEGPSYKSCHGLPFFALITATGDVIPCNLFYNNSDYTYGNINKSSFSDIWVGSRRKMVLNDLGKLHLDGCRAGCRLDSINRYLDRIKYPEPWDVFI